jgi:predicted HNH restriction endonuclease
MPITWSWADGGPTALQNLLLLCRRHHRMVHRRRVFRLELEDGPPVFRRQDGSVLDRSSLEERAPP